MRKRNGVLFKPGLPGHTPAAIGPWHTSLAELSSITHEVRQAAASSAAGGMWRCGGGAEGQYWHVVSKMFGMADVREKRVG